MKKCIITGGNSGIGYEAAMQIAAKGFHVTLMCRNEKKAIQSCKQISEKTDNPTPKSTTDWSNGMKEPWND